MKWTVNVSSVFNDVNTCMSLCREGGKYWDILNTYWFYVLNPSTNSVNAHVLLIDFLPHNPNFAAEIFGLVSPASYGFREFISVFTNCPFRLYPEPDELFPPSHPYRYYCVRPVHIPDAPHLFPFLVSYQETRSRLILSLNSKTWRFYF